VISCPSCARQQFEVIKTVERLEERLAHITTPMTVSVIGCVVNGPGEARETDIGFTGGGNGTHQVYINGLTYGPAGLQIQAQACLRNCRPDSTALQSKLPRLLFGGGRLI
jgi:4-hydroxy-3-methylbut-2-en-1-yl diphosphate synthase IspG/GcpE